MLLFVVAQVPLDLREGLGDAWLQRLVAADGGRVRGTEVRDVGAALDDVLGPSAELGRRTLALCEDCADRAREEAEIAEESESVIQDMMGFKGRR